MSKPPTPTITALRVLLQTRPLLALLAVTFVLGVLSPSLPSPPRPPPSPPPFLTFHNAAPCQPRLLLDTPSVPPHALLSALRTILPHRNIHICPPATGCEAELAAVCNGTLAPPDAFVGPLHASAAVVSCLRAQHGFYAALSTRTPLDAWSADYLAAPAAPEPYLAYMASRPACLTLHYFDLRGPACADDGDVRARVAAITARFDEAFDAYESRGPGPLYRRLHPALAGRLNHDRPSAKFRAFLDTHRLAGETLFYQDALQLSPPPSRVLCAPQVEPR